MSDARVLDLIKVHEFLTDQLQMDPTNDRIRQGRMKVLEHILMTVETLRRAGGEDN